MAAIKLELALVGLGAALEEAVTVPHAVKKRALVYSVFRLEARALEHRRHLVCIIYNTYCDTHVYHMGEHVMIIYHIAYRRAYDQ